MAGRGFSVVQNRPLTYTGDITIGTPTFSALTAPVYGSVITHSAQDQLVRLPTTGWLAVEKGSGGISRWSTDDGATWSDTYPGTGGGTKQGPYYSAQKNYGVLDGTSFFSLARTMVRSSGEPADEFAVNFDLSKWVADHEWTTVAINTPDAIGPIYIPDSKPFANDSGGSEVGFLMHHGKLMHTSDGAIMGLAYGCYAEDLLRPIKSYKESLGMTQFRTIALKSFDKLTTFQDPVTVADKYMQTRSDVSSPGVSTSARGWASVNEGFAEASMCRGAGGEILAVFRTGGYRWTASNVALQGTPVYMTRSLDEGLTWDDPWQLHTLPREASTSSGNPNIVRLGNGILVLIWTQSTGPEGNFIAFCNGASPYVFEGVTQLGDSSNYTGIEPIGYDQVGIIYTAFGTGRRYCTVSEIRLVGEGNDAASYFFSEPLAVQSGNSALLQWFDRNLQNLEIRGGSFSAGGSLAASGTSVSSNRAISTGNLTATTTYRLRGEDISNPGTYVQHDITVTVL